MSHRGFQVCFLFCAVSLLLEGSSAYRVLSDEAYPSRDSLLRILGSSVQQDALSRLNELLTEDQSFQLGRYGLQDERQYETPEWIDKQQGPLEVEDDTDSEEDYFDRVAKGDSRDEFETQELIEGDYGPQRGSVDDALANPMTRDQEYLQHSSLWGHQYIQGGAGEGNQILKPDGSQKNSQEMKTDAVLPAYCDPPNPCPVGYTGEDGCLEDFENTAAFSREYQEAQDCLCDAEHMFGCGDQQQHQQQPEGGSAGMGAGSSESDDNNDALDALLSDYKILGQHKTLVAKKFHAKKSDDAVKRYEEDISSRAKKAAAKYSKTNRANEFLEGDKLPIAAKKGMKLA